MIDVQMRDIALNLKNKTSCYNESYIIFDIETIRKTKTFEDLDDRSQDLWYNVTEKHKEFESYKKNDIPPSEIYEERAGLYPEYLTIACISLGVYDHEGNNLVSSLTLNDYTEKEMLEVFSKTLIRFAPNGILVGYNIINFDIDVIWKKMILYGIEIPKQLNTRIVKPWEMKVVDIMLKWQGTRYSFVPTLDMVANYLGFETSKSDLDGSKISEVYWNNEDGRIENVERISTYCKKDVNVCMKIFKKIKDFV